MKRAFLQTRSCTALKRGRFAPAVNRVSPAQLSHAAKDAPEHQAGTSRSSRLHLATGSSLLLLARWREKKVLSCAERTDFAADANLCAAASPAATAVEAKRPMSPALAVLLTGHVLRDGEVVQLILKPSIWFIPLTSLIFAAAVAICGMAATLWLPQHVAWYYVQAAVFLVAGRLMWATVQWVNRLYILTDQRVVRLSGAFNVEIFDCPLRRISQTRVVRNFRERLLRLGSIEIQPADESRSPGLWQTISHPREVEAMIREAMRKAQSGGLGF